jgi:hypothetical protein
MSPGGMSRLQQAAACAGILSTLVVVLSFLTGMPTLPAFFSSRPPAQPQARNPIAPAAFHVEAAPAAPRGTVNRQSGCPGPPGQLYIFPDSSNRILQPEELQSLPTYKLRIARNEIFARHGLRFYSDMKTYFACEPWYRATTDNVSNELSPVEHANIASILRAEHRQ